MNVVITGATRGIGRALAEKFASENWSLALCARTAADLKQLEQDFADRFPDCLVRTYVCDVGEKKQLKRFAREVLRHFKVVDVLVNNAGIFAGGFMHKEKDGTLEKLMKVNVYSAYYLTRYLIKPMLRQRSGHIINLCSTASIQPYSEGGSYGITKFALFGFSRNLRLELAPYNIRVTSVIAGATWTSSWKGTPYDERRFMQPADIAHAIWAACTMNGPGVLEEMILRPLPGDID